MATYRSIAEKGNDGIDYAADGSAPPREKDDTTNAGYDAAAHSIPGRYGVFEGQGGAFGTPGGGTYKGGVHVEERPAIDRPRGMSSRGY